jgi:hypothetical protein
VDVGGGRDRDVGTGAMVAFVVEDFKAEEIVVVVVVVVLVDLVVRVDGDVVIPLTFPSSLKLDADACLLVIPARMHEPDRRGRAATVTRCCG